jgi:hypothetical protein
MDLYELLQHTLVSTCRLTRNDLNSQDSRLDSTIMFKALKRSP